VSNAVLAFLDTPVSSGAADRPAIVTAAGSTTYRELLALACRAGNALRALGVQSEQRVALLLPDGLEWAAVFFGALRIGAVAVTMNTRLDASAWAAILRDSRARVLVADPALLAALRPGLADLPYLGAVVTTGAGPDDLDARLAAAAPELPAEPVSGDDMAFWLYTSGTTGGPKAAIHLHRNLLACRYYGVDVLGADERDRVFATSKLFFAYALGNALLVPLHVGARTYLQAAWPEPAGVRRVLESFAPTLFFSVPTFYGHLLRADLPRDTFRSVRACVSAGERLPVDVYEAWRDRFGVEILDGLGMSETIFMVLSNRPGKTRPGSAGTPVPGTDVRLLDADGQAVGADEAGVLHVRTPSASAGYWNRVDATRQTFIGEWVRTGDVFTRDADGFYHHGGRADDRFKVAGMWVAPADVEAALLSHPDVADAGVVGASLDGGLVKAVAFVVPRAAAGGAGLADALAAHLETRLPAYQRPRRIHVVDALPRTATGKLQRYLLRQQAGP
jgi:benzoate-CoA ligase family protein